MVVVVVGWLVFSAIHVCMCVISSSVASGAVRTFVPVLPYLVSPQSSSSNRSRGVSLYGHSTASVRTDLPHEKLDMIMRALSGVSQPGVLTQFYSALCCGLPAEAQCRVDTDDVVFVIGEVYSAPGDADDLTDDKDNVGARG